MKEEDWNDLMKDENDEDFVNEREWSGCLFASDVGREREEDRN